MRTGLCPCAVLRTDHGRHAGRLGSKAYARVDVGTGYRVVLLDYGTIGYKRGRARLCLANGGAIRRTTTMVYWTLRLCLAYPRAGSLSI